jgi:pyridoxamine 5'-phosphate oxidase family protein
MPRYLWVYGTAELERQVQFGVALYLRITPTISWSFNLNGEGFGHDRDIVIQRTDHEPPRDEEA